MTKAVIISCLVVMGVMVSCRPAVDPERDNQPEIPGGTSSLVDKIQGIWGMTGQETASFVIRKNEILYPEIDAGYRYYLKNDSIRIKYDEDERTFALHVQGPDTLILTGSERRVYYRYKE